MKPINKEKILAKLGHVVVLKGGASAEREISLISGSTVFNGLQKLGVNAAMIDVGNDIIDQLREAKPDLVVIMLHGKDGEDGVIQGMLEMMQLPYTGSGVLASAIAMDKELSKKTGCSIKTLKKIVKKGMGAYYSSGSRPNQTREVHSM